MISSIEKLTVEDIRRTAEAVFTGKVNNKGEGTGRATVVMQGEREAFGDVEGILKHYGLGSYEKSNTSALKTSKKKGWF